MQTRRSRARAPSHSSRCHPGVFFSECDSLAAWLLFWTNTHFAN